MFKVSLRWLKIIGILLFIWVAVKIDWLMVWKLLREIHLGYLLAYFGVFFIATLLKVFRLRWFLDRLGYLVSFSDVYRSVIEPAFYGTVTPARIGEFSKVLHLLRFGLSKHMALGLVLIERLVDFSVLFVASVAGFFYFMIFDATNNILVLVIFFILVATLYICLINIGSLGRHGSHLMGSLPWKHSLLSDFPPLGDGLARLGKLSAIIILPVSLVVLLLSFLQLFLLGLALNTTISGVYLGLAYAFSTLMALLPLSVGGLGTREAVYIATLGKVGVSENIAVTISLLDGLVFPLLFLVILFIPIFLFKQTVTGSRSISRQ